jgi:hypothetical protein
MKQKKLMAHKNNKPPFYFNIFEILLLFSLSISILMLLVFQFITIHPDSKIYFTIAAICFLLIGGVSGVILIFMRKKRRQFLNKDKKQQGDSPKD